MSKEVFDHDEGNAGLKKVHCLCVSHGMGTDSHSCQSGHGGSGPAQVLQQNVSRAVSPQSHASPVLEQWFVAIGTVTVRGEELTNELSRLWQQRAQPFASSFAT